ncbi:MAG: hypothetical protein COZ72_07650 [Elusimicrobia bacterium CG_4_8_14_3_um_filter_50_9]|nr:MAG: hypothetical protein COZ72_07650 [Elusimicrobia bacterium CG_4_8_14_3_um_filter_50_9]
MCPLLVKSAGQSRNDERQNENTGKSGAENCLLLLFFELKRKFVQETWFLEVPIKHYTGILQLEKEEARAALNPVSLSRRSQAINLHRDLL